MAVIKAERQSQLILGDTSAQCVRVIIKTVATFGNGGSGGEQLNFLNETVQLEFARAHRGQAQVLPVKGADLQKLSEEITARAETTSR